MAQPRHSVIQSHNLLYLAEQTLFNQPPHSDQKVQVIVPACDVLLTEVVLPKMKPHALLKALPFALEEKVLTPVETLHFAVGASQPDQAIPCAIVAKNTLEAWLATLQQLGYAAESITPLTLKIPFEPSTWHAIAETERITVRTGEASGFSCDKDNLKLFLELAIARAKIKPQRLIIYNLAEPWIDSKHCETLAIQEIDCREQDVIQLISSFNVSTPPINLLQGAYRPKFKINIWGKSWRSLSVMMVALLTLTVLNPLVSWFMLSQSQHKTQQEVAAIYHHYFPSDAEVIAPRAHMLEKLQQITHDPLQDKFLNLFLRSGSIFAKTEGLKIQRLDFQKQQLRFTLTAENFDKIEKLSKALQHRGLTVKEENATVIKNQVQVILIIS